MGCNTETASLAWVTSQSRIVALLIVAALGLGACGMRTPDCGSNDVLTVVAEVLQNDQSVADVYGTDIGPENIANIETRTDVEFEQGRRWECFAVLEVHGGSLTLPITYTVSAAPSDAERSEEWQAAVRESLAEQAERKRQRRWEGVHGGPVGSVGDGFFVSVFAI